MIKRFSKKTLSLILALVMVVTTFFIFDPDLLRVDSDAKAEVVHEKETTPLANQTLYATETIYLKPGSSAFQYFANYDPGSFEIKNPTDITGSVYFKNEDASNIELKVNRLWKKGNSVDETTYQSSYLTIEGTTVTKFALASGGADGSIASKFSAATSVATAASKELNFEFSSGSFSGQSNHSTDGVYFIEWIVKYEIGGVTHYAFVYTGIYSTSLSQAGITYKVHNSGTGNVPKQSGYSFITGAMAYAGGNARSNFVSETLKTGSTGLSAPYTAPLISFVGQMNNGSTYTIAGGDSKYTSTDYFPDQANGGVARTSSDPNAEDSYYRTTSWTVSNSGSYASPGTSGTMEHGGDYTAGIAYIVVDSSRFSNYNQLPYLSVGWVNFWRERAGDENRVTGVTGLTSNSASSVGVGSTLTTDNWDTDDKSNSMTRGLAPLTGSIPTSTSLYNIRISTRTKRDLAGDNTVNAHCEIGLKTEVSNKATLRANYQNALNTVADYQNINTYNNKETVEANKVNYSAIYNGAQTVAQELCDPTTLPNANNSSTLLSNTQKAVDKIASMYGAEVTFLVPEAIYTKPQGSYGAGNNGVLHYAGAYVNNIYSTSGIQKQTGDQKYGELYFNYNYAEEIKISFQLEDNDTSSTSSYVQFSNDGSANGATNVTIGSKYALGSKTAHKYITGGGFPFGATDSSYESGYWIKWTASYYDTLDGRTKVAEAYTYVYRTFYLPIEVLIETAENDDYSWNNSILWISGVQDFEQVTNINYTGDSRDGWGSSGKYIYSKTTEGRRNIPYAYTFQAGTGSSYSASSETFTKFVKDGDIANDHAISGEDMYRYPFSSSDDTQHFEYPGNGGNHWGLDWFKSSIDNASYYPTGKPANSYWWHWFSGSKRDVYNAANGPAGKMVVDTSRYSNLNQVPGFSVGLMQTDYTKIEKAVFYVSDFTGYTEHSDFKWGHQDSGWDKSQKVWSVTGKVFGGVNSTSINKEGKYDGIDVKYAGKGNIALSGSKRYTVKAAYDAYDKNNKDLTNFMYLYIDVTAYDKSQLREAVLYAIEKSNYLDSVLFNTADTQWTEYQRLFREASRALTMVDGSDGKDQTAMNNLATQLKAAVNNLLSKDSEGNWTCTARREGTLTVRHVAYDPVTKTITNNNLKTETATFKYGDSLYTSYETVDNYNYFGVFRSLNGATWNGDLGQLSGDIAAQGTYGSTGVNEDRYFTDSNNIAYTYVYTVQDSNLYIDLGESDHAFENAENLLSIDDDLIVGNYTFDGTTGNVNVYSTSEDSLNWEILQNGKNEDTPAGRMPNLFNYQVAVTNLASNYAVSEVDLQKRNKLRMTGTGSGKSNVFYSQAVTANNEYIFFFNFCSNTSTPYGIKNEIAFTDGTSIHNATFTPTDRSGQWVCRFVAPKTGTVNWKIYCENGSADYDLSNFAIYNATTYGNDTASMNDFVINNATGTNNGGIAVEPGKTYTISFTSNMLYDRRRWYLFDMYGNSMADSNTALEDCLDWSHNLNTIQMFVFASNVDGNGNFTNNADQHGYTVIDPVNLEIAGNGYGSIGTFTVPTHDEDGNPITVNAINLGFCVTSDRKLSGTIENLRIVEGDFIESEEEFKNKNEHPTFALRDGQGVVGDPTWEGYTFTGWTKSADSTATGVLNNEQRKYTFGRGDDTIVANWQVNYYDVLFDNLFDFDKGWGSVSNAAGQPKATLTIDNEENSIRVTDNSAVQKVDGDDATKSYDDANSTSVARWNVTPGNRYRVYIDYENHATSSKAQVHLFFYNAVGASGFVDFIGKGSTSLVTENYGLTTPYPTMSSTKGTFLYDFVVPEGYVEMSMRLGTTVNGSDITYSNIYVQDITRGTVGDESATKPYFESTGNVFTGATRPYKTLITDIEEFPTTTVTGSDGENSIVHEFPVIDSDYYDFDGWYYLNKQGVEEKLTDESTYAIPSKTTHVYSKWTISISYDVNGGSYIDAAQAPQNRAGLPVNGASETIKNYIPYKVGYNFAGWKVDSNYMGSGVQANAVLQPGDNFTFDAKVKLTAVWENAQAVTLGTEYAVEDLRPGEIYFYSYKSNDKASYVSAYTYFSDVVNLDSQLYYSSAQGVNLPTAISKNNNKTFFGVEHVDEISTNEVANGGTAYYGITSTTGNNADLNGMVFAVNEHKVKYTFNLSGGSVGGNGQSIVLEGSLNNPPVEPQPTLAGNTFSSWAIGSPDSSEFYTSSQNNNYVKDAEKTSFVSEMYLYATWTPKTYKITAYAYSNAALDYSTASTDYQNNYVGGKVRITQNNSTEFGETAVVNNAPYNAAITYQADPETGYSFIGWYSSTNFTEDNQLSTDAVFDTVVPDVDNYKIYARFDINQYTITLGAYSDNVTNSQTGTAPGTFIATHEGGSVGYGTDSTQHNTTAVDVNVITTPAIHGQDVYIYANPTAGWDFMGWYTNTGDLVNGELAIITKESVGCIKTGNSYAYRVRVDESRSYYAKFAIKQVTLTIDEGFQPQVNEQTITRYPGETYTLQVPTRVGYAVKDWTLERAEGGTADGEFNPTTRVYTFGGTDDKLTAVWKLMDYSIKVDSANGILGAIGYYKADGNSSATGVTWDPTTDIQNASSVSLWAAFDTELTLMNPTKTGHTFDGWILEYGTGDLTNRTGSEESTYKVGVNDVAKIKATWTVNSYELKLEAYGNTVGVQGTYQEYLGGTVKIGDGVAETTVTENVPFNEDRTVTAVPDTGYAFVGWTEAIGDGIVTNVAVTNPQKSFTHTMEAKNATYYALFQVRTYKLSTVCAYNTAETPEDYTTGFTGGSTSGAGSYLYKQEVTLSATPRTGYTFEGWFSSLEATSAIKYDSEYTFEFDETSPIVAEYPDFFSPDVPTSTIPEATVYAKFSLKKITVIVSTKCNSADSTDVFKESNTCGTVEGAGNFYFGTSVTLTATATPGYVFLGWYSDNDLQTSVGTDNTYTFTIQEDKVYSLYAKFELESSNVTLYTKTVDIDGNIDDDAVGGKAGFVYENIGHVPADGVQARYYTNQKYSVYAQADTGYEFAGWFKDATLQTPAHYAHVDNNGLGYFKENSYYHQEFTKQATDETLYAKFGVASCTLEVYAYSDKGDAPSIYSANGSGGTVSIESGYTGTVTENGAMRSATVFCGVNAVIAATPAIGYTFDGWYKDVAFTTLETNDATHEFVMAMTPTAKVQYFAKFSIGRFNIMFDATTNGGANSDNRTIEVYYGQDVMTQAYTPTRTGYDFEGWSESADSRTGDWSITISAAQISSWYHELTQAQNDTKILYSIWTQKEFGMNIYSMYWGSNNYLLGNNGGTVTFNEEKIAELAEDSNGNPIFPEGAPMETYLVFTPATGYMLDTWRYARCTGANDVPDSLSSYVLWGNAGTGQGMPNYTVDVIAFFGLNSFNMTFYAYNNSAADQTEFINSAAGGTVKITNSESSGSRGDVYNQPYRSIHEVTATQATGYTFMGWYGYGTKAADETPPAGTFFDDKKLVSQNAKYSFVMGDSNEDPNANTYFAIFTINTYNATVSYRTYSVGEDIIITDSTQDNGGYGVVKGGKVGIGLSKNGLTWTGGEGELERTISVCYRQRVYYKAEADTGYYFAGWYSTPNATYYGSALVDDYNAEFSRIQKAGDTYLEAKFFPEIFTLSLDKNGGIAGNPAEIRVTFGQSFLIEKSSQPTRTGFIFNGWSDSVDGAVVEAYNTRINAEIISNWYNSLDSFRIYTIYAVWTEAKVTITLVNGGGNASESIEINQGKVLPELENIPTNPGYIFGGYYTQTGGNGHQRYDEQGVSDYYWPDINGGELYAYWKTPVLKDVSYDANTKEWQYVYEEKSGGTVPVTATEKLTDKASVAKNAPAEAKWISSIDTVVTNYIDTQKEQAEKINLNHYSQAALTELYNSVKSTATDADVKALSQPQANEIVAKMATNMELGYEDNRKSETSKPTVTLYENSSKLAAVKGMTQEKNAEGSFQYEIPAGEEAASYAFGGKHSYTAGQAVDYYLYTNSSNPVIALEIGDGEVAQLGQASTSSYPTSAAITDNASTFSYVRNSGSAYRTSAVKATENADKAWFSTYVSAGIGSANDYNAKTVVYLTPEFTSSGTRNEIVYTIKPADDAYNKNIGVQSSGLYEQNGVNTDSYSSYDYTNNNDEEITICVCYHNSMNGASDEGTINGSGDYLQMYIDQVNADKYLKQMHLFRISGGASNWELPAPNDTDYPVEDATYPYSKTNYVLGSFMYVFDADTEVAATQAAIEGDSTGDYSAAKDIIVDRILSNPEYAYSAIINRNNINNINGSGTGLGFAQITGWSTNFYPKSTGDVYVYAHLVDRWGNVFNRVWKCFKVDQYASSINENGAGAYSIFEQGGSNIDYVSLDAANATFSLDSTSSYENGVLTTTGNTLTILTGEPNKTFNLKVVDKATNETTTAVTSDSNGMLVISVEDKDANLNSGGYAFNFNDEKVNLYSGEPSLVRDASVNSVAIYGNPIEFTVKTASDVTKVQVVENGATWTYERTNPLATVEENADGTLTWKFPINAAYLGEHTYGVRARTWDRWEDVKFNLTCKVILPSSTNGVALSEVLNAQAIVGERPVIKARTATGTEKLQVVYADGNTITFNRNESIILSSVDGVETWALSITSYGAPGEYTVNVIAKVAGQWQTFNTRTSTITVKEAETPKGAVIHSVDYSNEVKRGKYAEFTVLTSGETTRLRFALPNSTTTFNTSNSTVEENADGTKTWTVKVRFWSKGEMDVNFSAKSDSQDWTAKQVFGKITVN